MRPEIGGSDPAAGVDPWTEDEPQMIRVDPLAEAGDRGQRGETAIAVAPRNFDPLRDQRPIDAGERYDIANRAERHQIEPLQQVWLGATAGVPAGAAQSAVDRDGEQKSDADCRQLAMRAHLVETVRIDDRESARQ